MHPRRALYSVGLCLCAVVGGSISGACGGGSARSSSGSSIEAGLPDAPNAGAEVDALMPPADAGTDQGQAPPPVVGACSNLAAVGTFEDVTPPMAIVDGSPQTFAIAADPHHLGTFFVGTTYHKLWKTQDCGATWDAVATGVNGDAVNSGMNWTIALNPVVPDVVYTNSGYGMDTNGLYKSTNGGVDWSLVWPPPAQPALAMAFTYNFANVVAMDPAITCTSSSRSTRPASLRTRAPASPSRSMAEGAGGSSTATPGGTGTKGRSSSSSETARPGCGARRTAASGPARGAARRGRPFPT